MKKRTDKDPRWVNLVLWLVYIFLLAVLLPHTAWAFSQLEPTGKDDFGIPWGVVVAWAAAFAFECTIAVMTHKLAKHIERASNSSKWPVRWQRRYANAYFGGLMLAWGVSSLANLAHSVEFGQPMVVFAAWGIPAWVYSVALGAALPTLSLLFALVLSSSIEADVTEDEVEEALNAVKAAERAAKRETAKLQNKLDELRRRYADYEPLYGTDRKARILAAARLFPDLSGAGIAVVAKTSTGYVSEVLRNGKETK